MTKKIVLAAALALLAAPTAAAEERPAPGEKGGKETRAAERHVQKAELKLAMRHCAELKKQLGRVAFEAAYPTFRACVLARVQAERANRSEAKAECLAKLGKRANGKRLRACMAKSAAADSALEREAVVSAAKACAEELSADPAGFRAEYGKNHNLANAFGKCVAMKSKARAEDENTEVDEHEDEKEVDDADEDEPDDGEVAEDDAGEESELEDGGE
jgi:hypothetical protein